VPRCASSVGDVTGGKFVLRRLLLGVLASAASIAAVTGVVEALKGWVPVLSLGGLYVLAVLPVAIGWGLGYALPVAVVSMLAFEFLFLPPLYSLAIADPGSWFALLIFAVTAIVVSELATRSRRRAREAELLAQVATSLLVRGEVSAQLDAIAADAARALEVDRARIELGADTGRVEGELEQALVVDRRQVGRIVIEGHPRRFGSVGKRMLSALASLISVAIEHERLAEEAYQAEVFRRSDALKTAIIQAVSHDLRTPLATIETALGTLQEPRLVLAETDRVELLEAIGAEHARLKRLVENLLDLSRLQAGVAEPMLELWTIDQLFANALEDVEGAERVDVVIAGGLPVVRADGAQIQRVLVNLLENALKFSSQNVNLRATSVGPELVIRVTNRGRGIPHAELARIFEPFQRVAGERVSGAGLGLAIAKGFAEANDGRIWAESKLDQGASFVLALPSVETPVLVST
jgi:two-component system, OmpR family, sensor histidine kinase KdpD